VHWFPEELADGLCQWCSQAGTQLTCIVLLAGSAPLFKKRKKGVKSSFSPFAWRT